MGEAQRQFKKRYNKETMKRITIDFYPADADLWSKIQTQSNKQGYIKDLIRQDIKKEGEA